MLLALGEIKHNKLKFSLIVLALGLIVFLLLMLSALGSGLIVGMAGAVQTLDADLIVYQADAHRSLQRSNLPITMEDKLRDVESVDRAIPFGQLIVTAISGGKSFDTALMLTEIDPMINLDVNTGGKLKKSDADGVVVDGSIARNGVGVGDYLTVDPIGKKLKIIGMTNGRRLSMMPTAYVSGDTWQAIKIAILNKATPGVSFPKQRKSEFVNAFLIKAKPGQSLKDLKAGLSRAVEGIEPMTMDEAISSFSGIGPMTMVVNALKGLSVIIGAVIVGIFFYILTLQKIGQVGMVKALGASSGYVFRELVFQVGLLTLIAIAVGTALAYAAGQMVPPEISMSLGADGVILSTLSVLAMSFLGALFSVRRIIKIDPIIALGRSD